MRKFLTVFLLLVGGGQLFTFIAALGMAFWGWPALIPAHLYRAYAVQLPVFSWLAVSTLGLLIYLIYLPKASPQSHQYAAGYAFAVAIGCLCMGFVAEQLPIISSIPLYMCLFMAIRPNTL